MMKTENKVASSEQRVVSIVNRLINLPRPEQEFVIFATLGELQSLAIHRPQARIGRLFEVLDARVARREASARLKASTSRPAIYLSPDA